MFKYKYTCVRCEVISCAVRTDDHASTDVTELGLLAVVVLELVRFVVDPKDWIWRRFWFLLLHLHLLLINKIDLKTQTVLGYVQPHVYLFS